MGVQPLPAAAETAAKPMASAAAGDTRPFGLCVCCSTDGAAADAPRATTEAAAIPAPTDALAEATAWLGGTGPAVVFRHRKSQGKAFSRDPATLVLEVALRLVSRLQKDGKTSAFELDDVKVSLPSFELHEDALAQLGHLSHDELIEWHQTTSLMLAKGTSPIYVQWKQKMREQFAELSPNTESTPYDIFRLARRTTVL